MKHFLKPDMKNASLVRQLQRLNWLIDNTRRASGDQLELQAHWGRYLCVLVAGFLENAIGEIYSEYARRAALTVRPFFPEFQEFHKLLYLCRLENDSKIGWKQA